MNEYYCPKCGAILNDQYGFSPDVGTWRCKVCDELLMDEDVHNGDSFDGVAWYCDSCGALLNRQLGFSDSYGSWTCTNCGYCNGTTSDDIIDGNPEFSCPNCGVALDFQPGFNRYDDDCECTACGTHLWHGNSWDQYEVVKEPKYICPNCEAALDTQWGFNEYDNDCECRECGARLHHNYSDDDYTVIKYICPNCNSSLDIQWGFSKYNNDYECKECGARLHHNYSDDDYSVVKHVCPNCNASLDAQWGFSENNDDWECTECGAHLYHDYGDEECEEEDVEDDTNDIEDDFESYNFRRNYSSTTNFYNNSSSNRKSEYSSRPNSSGLNTSSDMTYSAKPKREVSKKARIIETILLLAVIFIIGAYYEIRHLIPVGSSSSELIGRDYKYVISNLEKAGFTSIKTNEIADLSLDEISEENKVEVIKIGFVEKFNSTSKYPSNFPVEITYHTLEKYMVPMASKEAKGVDYQTVRQKFMDAGFENITLKVEYDIITGWLTADGEVKSVIINGDSKFSAEEEYRADAEIVITYHTYRRNKPT